MERKKLVNILENFFESVGIGWKTKAFFLEFCRRSIIWQQDGATWSLHVWTFNTYKLDALHKFIIKDREMLGNLPGLRTKLCVIYVSAG